MTTRRKFITLVGGAAAAWPVVAISQQRRKLPTIGFIGSNEASQRDRHVAFVKRLQELGWSDGNNVIIEYRWWEGNAERAAEIAAEFVRMNVDVLVTAGTAPGLALKKTTSTIQIVVATMGDPIATGMIASLARPGGNVTGLSVQQADLGSKRLEILRELVPGLRRLAILANVGAPSGVNELRQVLGLASSLSLQITSYEIRRSEDIAPAFDAFKDRVQALYVVSDPLMAIERARVGFLGLGARLPTIHGFRAYVESGGLVSYGPNFPDLYRRAAEYVDKILRSAKPADLPVEQPTKFELVVNLITAKAIGITVPPSLLARADEVIE